MTYLSSSLTISRGVNADTAVAVRSGRTMATFLQLFDGEIRVGINADVGRDLHRLSGNLPGIEWTVPDQCARRCHGVGAARPHRHNSIVGFDQIAGAGEQKGRLAIG